MNRASRGEALYKKKKGKNLPKILATQKYYQ
jgi:hypothetical protein